MVDAEICNVSSIVLEGDPSQALAVDCGYYKRSEKFANV
jgi:hypothetical protein